MRSHRNDLVQLIDTLTGEEVRQCLHHLTQSRSKHRDMLLNLFRAMQKKGFDEAAFKNATSKSLPHADVVHCKRALAALVHRALEDLYRDLTDENRIEYLIQRFQLLLRKGLYAQCNLAITEALELARKYDYDLLELRVLGHQAKLLVAWHVSYYHTEYAGWSARTQLLAARIGASAMLSDLHQQVFMLQRQHKFCRTELVRKQLESLVRHPLLSQPELAVTFHDRHFFNTTWQLYFQMRGRVTESIAAQRKVVALWDSHPHHKLERPDRYRVILINMCGELMRQKRWDECYLTLQEARKHRLVSEADNVKYFREVIVPQLTLAMNMRHPERIRASVKELGEGLHKYGDRLQLSGVVAMHYNAAVACFLLEDNRDSLKWLVRLDVWAKEGVRKDLMDLGPMLRLMVCHRMGRMDTVEMLLRAAQRRAESGHVAGRFEKALLNHFDQLLCTTDSMARNELFEQFLAHLRQWSHEQRSVAGVEEAEVWARTCLYGITPLQAMEWDYGQTG